MKYIIEGPAIDLVLRENRLRIQRGDITVTPLPEDAAPVRDGKDVPEDTKDVPVTDAKKPVKKGKK